jgi:hypothetical protein
MMSIFTRNAVSTFVARVSNVDELTRKKQDFPSKNRLKQIQVGWLGRIDILRQLIATCDILEGRKSTLFLKVVDIVKELEGPTLIRDSTLLTKDQMEAELSTLKVAWGTEFDDLTNSRRMKLDVGCQFCK